MTRTVRDNAILLEQMGTGAERRDYTRHLDGGARGLKIGFVRQFHEEDLVAAPDIIAALDEAAAVFRREGAIVQDVRLPSLAEFDNVTRLILIAEATAIHERWLRQRPEDYAELTRQRMLPGFFFSATDYIQAQRRRTELALAIEEAFWEADILLVANSMDEACRIDDRSEIDFTYPRQARMPFNTSGHPAISLMCGRGKKYGMPLSLQLVGRPFDEALLYRAASAFERATPWKDKTPNLDRLIVATAEVPAHAGSPTGSSPR
jgi:aspartyl-tRNA(Asn)/glutamyl-tRNA(Gln) amidotransferase subunit A